MSSNRDPSLKENSLAESESLLRHHAQQLAMVAKNIITARMPPPRPEEPELPHVDLTQPPSPKAEQTANRGTSPPPSVPVAAVAAPSNAKAAFMSYDSGTC